MVAAIAGTAGVGKTTLALVWAHRVRHQFPDGQLYVNLRGYDPGPPANPAEVLDGFLRALNVAAGKIPPTMAERAGLFRSLTDGRRMLIVLDNASSAEQVRPLLPGSTSCLVLVTSRVMLTGLAATVGVARINLELLSRDEAITLLRTVIGAERAAAEPGALLGLADLCARLPLALQVAGQRAAARPRIRLMDLLAELSDETRRLEILSAGTDEFTALRPAFSWSYRNLTEAQARMFRLLGLHPGPDLRAHAVAALSATAPEQARHLLDGLTEAHLVEDAGRGGFRMHDLLRAFAREQATAEETQDDAREAVRRLVNFNLHATAAADRLIYPGRRHSVAWDIPQPDHPVAFTCFDEAVEWCETERANLIAVAGAAAALDLPAAWRLPSNLGSFYQLRKHWSDRSTMCHLGLAAADRLNDTRGQGLMLAGLAIIRRELHRFDESIDLFQQMLELARRTGDQRLEASALSNLGDVHLGLGKYDTALEYSQQSLEMAGGLGNTYVTGIAMGNMAEAYLGLARYDDALELFGQVLVLCRESGHRYGEGLTMIHLGESHLGLRQFDDAFDDLGKALAVCREIGDRHSEAVALKTLGHVHHAAGELSSARRHWRAALVIFDELDDPEAGKVREQLRLTRNPMRAGRSSV